MRQREAKMAKLHPVLEEILACPRCKGEVEIRAAEEGVVCHACRLVYPIRQELPVMLVDEARPLVDAG